MSAAAGRDPLRARRLLRGAALLLILPLIAYVVYSLMVSRGKGPVPSVEQGSSAGAPSSEMQDFSFDQTEEGRSLYSMSAGRLLGTDAGVYLLEEVRDFTIHRGGSNWVINAPRGELVAPDGRLASVRLEGGVTIESGQKRKIEAPVLTYDNASGVLNAESDVRFEEGDLTGEAAGLRRDVVGGSTTLEGPVTLRGREGALDGWTIRAAGMRRASDDSPLDLQGPVGLARGRDAIQARSATILPPSRGQSAVFEGEVRGSLVRPALPGQPGPDDGTPVTFVCDRLEIERESPGMPARARLLGRASLVYDDTSAGAQSLDAPEIIVDLTAGGGLGTVSAGGGVTLRRGTLDGAETLTARSLEYELGDDRTMGGSANGEVRLVRGGLSAGGRNARFDDGQFSLTGDRPWAREATGLVLADTIRMDRKTGTISALGRTKTTLGSAVGAGEIPFPGAGAGGPVYVSASEAVFSRGGESVRFIGPVRAWREDSSIQSDAMEVSRNPGVLMATGHAVVRGKRGDSSGVTTPFTIRSSSLRYEESTRHLTCSDEAHYSEDGTSLRARTISATGSATAGGLDHLVAEEDVRVSAGSRTGTGDRAEFFAAGRKIALTGGSLPATFLDGDTGRRVSAAALTLDLAANTITIPGNEGERARIEVRDLQRTDGLEER